MIQNVELERAFDEAIHSFLLEEIERKSIASKIAQVTVFDKGSKVIIEREGEAPIEIEPKEYSSRTLIRKEYIIHSNFDMIRALFESLATKMADKRDRAMIEELATHAGTEIDAKGDVLGGLIEAVTEMQKKGHSPDTIIASPDFVRKLHKALEEDPERAESLKKLLSGKE